MIKACTVCGEQKPVAAFRSRGGAQKHLYKSRCNTCLFKEHREWVSQNPDRVKEYRAKDPWTLAKRCARRGVTPEELANTFEHQKCSCAICHKAITLMDSAIDHNHDTGEFRGVLCKQCNRALGMFGDSASVLMSAVGYLESAGSYGNG